MDNSIKIGDAVIYGGDSRNLKAKVVDIKMSPYFPGMLASIEFEDSDLLPRIMDVPIEYVTLLHKFRTSNMDSCICGLKFTREGGRHSDWCVVKNEE